MVYMTQYKDYTLQKDTLIVPAYKWEITKNETPEAFNDKYGEQYDSSILVDGGLIFMISNKMVLLVDEDREYHRICKPAVIETSYVYSFQRECVCYEWYNHGKNLTTPIFTWAMENDIDLLNPSKDESNFMKLMWYC